MTTMERTKGYILITGGSSGIGLALAKEAAKEGHDLILVARNRVALVAAADQLCQNYGVKVEIIPMDCAIPGAAKHLWERLEADGLLPDAIINNAGFGKYGNFMAIKPWDYYEMVMLNINFLTEFSRFMLPGMIARGSGRIMQVASTAGLMPAGPGFAVYYATKAYVVSLTRALAIELRRTGVTMTLLCPGPVHTKFGERSGMSIDRSAWLRCLQVDVSKVARLGYRSMIRGRRLCIPGLMNRYALGFASLWPQSWQLALLGRVNRQDMQDQNQPSED
jgi:uncharacterized protein